MNKNRSREMSRNDLLRALTAAELHSNEIVHNLLVTTIVAHWRAGEVSKATAAKACNMSEDNFMRAVGVVDNEARRMLKEALEPKAPAPTMSATIAPHGLPQPLEQPAAAPNP